MTTTKSRGPFQAAGMAPATVEKIRRAAGMRGWTLAQYVTALVNLHEDMRKLADGLIDGERINLEKLLTKHGLETVNE